MQKNLAVWDRWVRAIAGIVLFIVGGWVWNGWHGTWYGIVSLVIGIVLFVTGTVGWCPCYSACKFSTAQERHNG